MIFLNFALTVFASVALVGCYFRVTVHVLVSDILIHVD